MARMLASFGLPRRGFGGLGEHVRLPFLGIPTCVQQACAILCFFNDVCSEMQTFGIREGIPSEIKRGQRIFFGHVAELLYNQSDTWRHSDSRLVILGTPWEPPGSLPLGLFGIP